MTSWSARAAAVVLALGLALGAGSAAMAQSPLKTADFDQFAWRWIGPVNFSGRITEYAVPPGQSRVYYVLTASGGLWKTEDGGTHFEPLFEKYGNMSMGYLAIAPADPNILYLGTGEAMHARSSSRGNGVWKSVDAGKTWTHAGLSHSYFINKVAVHPKNPDIAYVAAEGKLYDNATDCERGLFKTTDGGKTWVRAWPLEDRGAGDFVMDPRNPDVIVAAAYKTYRRTWTFIDRQPGNDLYKTTDGGSTWTKLTRGLPQSIDLGRTGLTQYAKNPDILYARIDEEVNLGLNLRENAANFQPFRMYKDGWSIDRLKGYTFKPELAKLVKFEPIAADDDAGFTAKLNEVLKDKDFLTKAGVDLAALNAAARKAYAKNKDVLDAIAEAEKAAALPESDDTKGRWQVLNRHVLEMLYAEVLRHQAPVKRSGVIYRSEDLGESWTRMTEYKHSGGSGLINQTEAGYYGRAYVDPNNDQVIYCTDTNATVSTDGGRTFKPTGWDSGPFSLHVDHRGLWIDPLDSNHIMSANDGGSGESWDGGKHWSQKATISAQQFYDVAVDNELPYNVMGGTQDNGCWLGPSQNRNRSGVYAADWRYLPTGDGFYAVRDWWNPEFVYYESQFGSSSRMNLNTGEVSSLAKRTTPEETAKGVPAQRYQWNAPIVLSPHNPGIVYVCSQFVHRSLTRGEPGTFVTISPDLTRADPARIEESRKTNLQYATIYTFAESAKKPGLYWAGTDDGNVQVSTDGGVHWTNVTASFHDLKSGKPKAGVKGAAIPFDRWVKRVVPSAHDENTCYVAFSGYRTHNEDKTYVFVTKDLGKTWEDISGGMMNPVFDLEEDPHNPDVLYLGTDYGVFVTVDRGKTWTEFSSAAPDVIIRDLAIQKRDRDMVIGTYGRGIYIADIGPIKEFKPEAFQADAHLFDVEETVRWNRFEQRGESYGVFAKVDNPAVNALIYYHLKAEAKSAKLVIKDQAGAVVQELTAAAKPGLQKVAWNLSRRAAAGQAAAMAGGMRRGRGANLVDPGIYKVTLIVNDKEIATKDLKVSPDPLFK